MCPPTGDERGVVVIGSVNLMSNAAADILLKPLEEHDPDVQPILWATEMNGVLPTIQSRSLMSWCPGQPGNAAGRFEDLGVRIVESYLKGDVGAILAAVTQQRGSEYETLVAISVALAARADDPRLTRMWVRVRDALEGHRITYLQMLGAVVPDGE